MAALFSGVSRLGTKGFFDSSFDVPFFNLTLIFLDRPVYLVNPNQMIHGEDRDVVTR